MKNLLKNQDFQLNEILFEKRNKNYGAYVLRNDADKILTKAMFLGIGLFAAVAITPFVVNSLKTNAVISKDPVGPFDFIPIDETPDVKPPKEIPQVTPIVNTINTQVPTPTKNPVKENPPAKVVDYAHAVAGFENTKGNPPVVNVQPPNIPIVTEPIKEPMVPKIPENSIPSNVDVEASFNGGIDAFRGKVQQNFDTSNFEGTGDLLKATITFIVEKDGTISQIKTSGGNAEFNREAEKTIKSVKGKWIPAKLNGEFVRSYFKFPISMKFE